MFNSRGGDQASSPQKVPKMNPVPVGPSGSGLTVHMSRGGSGMQNMNVVGGRMMVGGTVNQNPPMLQPGPGPVQRKSGPPPGGKLMRLRCRFRPLHDAYIKNGVIVEDDSDVIFICGDGHQLRAHKVILASSSQFFAKLFEDQGKTTAVVSVPDIKVDVMKLILSLTYRDRVIVSMKQIKEVGDFIIIFGMGWTQFGYEEYEGEEGMTAQPMNPVPMKPVELPKSPRKIIYVTQRNSGSQQQQQQQQRILGALGGNQPPIRLASLNQPLKNEIDSEDYLYQQQQAQAERHSRKTKLTPRAGIDGEHATEHDDDEDPENKMRDWMAGLGKRNPSTSSNQMGGDGEVKKMRLDNDPLKVTKQQQAANKDFMCTTCNAIFKTQSAWRWHEDRHVGVNKFKCQFCDELVQTPKMCFIHEKETHGFNGMKTSNEDLKPPPQHSPAVSPQKQQNVPVRPNNPSKGGAAPSGYAASASKIKMGYKKMQTMQKKKPANFNNFANKHPNIQIGKSQAAESFDAKKMKQLHWLYVCQKCENCSDSASKAVVHYNTCYPNAEIEFEKTVVKHKQGFYGKSKCPLCPKSYPQNNGFMIHCGHQHQQYRKLFTNSSSGTGQDQLKCVTCKILFPDPTTFHEHMVENPDGSYICESDAAQDEDSSSSPQQVVPPAAKNPVGRPPNSTKPKLRKSVKRPESPMESKASYKVQFHTPPKSARLASRIQAEASAAEATKAKAKMTSTSIDFPSVDCPVCGEGDVPNISLHLQNKHTDLKLEMARVSSELLRCKHCTITFSICDLLDHKNCHLANEPTSADADATEPLAEENTSENEGKSSRRSSTAASASGSTGRPHNPKHVADIDSLPPGVGRSPIEKIEIEDLHSIHAIRSALKCAVCGVTATKLGVIADCLRSHGVQRCSLCFNSYCNKADYTLHLKKCHGSSTGNKLKCPLCPKAFSNAGQTSGHMYSTHWLQILKENELAVKTNKKSNAKETAESKKDKGNPTGTDGKAEQEEMNGSAELEEESVADDDDESARGEEDDDGGDETGQKDDMEDEENGDGEEDMMQVEGCNEIDMDPEDDIDAENNE